MAIVLDATVGGEFSNAFTNIAYADEYFENHYNSVKKAAWQALTDEAKEAALMDATQILEQFNFIVGVLKPTVSDMVYDPRTGKFLAYVNESVTPTKYNYFQALQFPRSVDVYTDGTLYIPEKIKRATCEQAVYLLAFDDSALANRLQGITMDRVSIGQGAISATQEYGLGGTMLAPTAHQLIRPYLVNTSRVLRA
jgi:hypothetical protein